MERLDGQLDCEYQVLIESACLVGAENQRRFYIAVANGFRKEQAQVGFKP